MTIKDWSNKYIVLDSSMIIELEFDLRHARTGRELWTSTEVVQRSTGAAASGDPVAALIGAALGYLLSEAFEMDFRPLARQAAWQAFNAPADGLPSGPYSPHYGADRDRYAPATKN